MAEASETIERALAAAGLSDPASPLQGAAQAVKRTLAGPDLSTLVTKEFSPLTAELFGAQAGHAPAPAPVYQGSFQSHSYIGPAGSLDYKLYVPSTYAAKTLKAFPLIVMLHGCTQSPDDFAAGTCMNELAEIHGFLVAYPAQTISANSSKCWNWFRSEDQGRERGEPSLIAGVTREVAAHYRVDEHRIFVAGLSAGAAMAVVLGTTYPELYAGVAAHSGLAYAVAHNATSAFNAMRSGSSAAAAGGAKRSVPTIVFHGDRDNTVNVKNGSEIVEHAIASSRDKTILTETVETGVAAKGGTFTRTVYAEGPRPYIEYWRLHGAGHAWSGGSPRGSYTSPHGPDASSEIVRFFYSQA